MYKIRGEGKGNRIVFVISFILTYVAFQGQLSVLIKLLSQNTYFDDIAKGNKCTRLVKSLTKTTMIHFMSLLVAVQ